MDEALLVDLLALGEYRSQLVAENAPAEEWYRYRVWRARVMAAVDVPSAVDASAA